jgi:hypothetical protein
MAARSAADWQSLGTAYPDRIASLTLVCLRGPGAVIKAFQR